METRLVLVIDSGLSQDQEMIDYGRMLAELLLADGNVRTSEIYVERIAPPDSAWGFRWLSHGVRNPGDEYRASIAD